MRTRTQNAGFTLVEIAIVLVVIGLLIGGVLKGQEMITNAKVKRIESDNAGVSAAIFSYQDRYQQLPGDDDAATTRFNALAASALCATPTDCEGNNSGTVDGAWNDGSAAATNMNETRNFWRHLRSAGLVAGAPDEGDQPNNPYGGLIGIQDQAFTFGTHAIVFGQIDGNIAKILEGRLDDDTTNAGRIMGATTAVVVQNGAPEASGTYNDATRYNLAFRL